MRVNQNPSRLMACLSVVSLVAFMLNSGVPAPFDPVSKRPSFVLQSGGLAYKSYPARTQGAPSSMMQMPMVIPLFIQNQDFSSTLVLTNSADQSTYADVILMGTDGREITRRRVEFTAHSQRNIDIAPLLQSVLSGSTTGSISIMQSPELLGAVILGQLSMTHRGTHDSTYIDEEVAMPTTMGSQLLRGVADAGSGSPLLAITSLSETGQRVTIRCFPSKGESRSKSVDLLPGETLLTEACAERTIHGAVMESFAPSEPTEHRSLTGPMGISLVSDAKPGSFVAFGLVPHRKDGERFFSTLNFSDPKMLLTATTIFTGVPVGPTTLLREANYVPNLSLTNFSAKDLQVHVRYAQTIGATPTTKEIAALTVPAGSSTEITFDNLQGDPLQNSFLITSNGAPGDLLSKLVSMSGSALHQVEMAGKDENDMDNTGSHPWSLEGGTESTLLLFNHNTKPQSFDVAISGNGVRWQSTYHLTPMQTEAISIRDLIEHKVKDETGKTLPRSAQSGQLSWFTGAPGQGKGRLLQSNRAVAMARNFSCGAPGGLCSASFVPGITYILLGSGTTNFGTAFGIQCTADPNNPRPCFGTFNGPGSGYQYNWVSNDHNIILIDHSAPSGQGNAVFVNGVAIGSTGVHAQIYDSQGCNASTGGIGHVTSPTYFFSPSAAQTGTPSVCVINNFRGYFLDVSYYVADSSSSRVSDSGMAPGENLGDGTGWHDAYTTPNTTNSDGSFDDTPFGACYPPSVPTHYCEAGPPQSFRLTANSTVYSILTHNTSRKCTDGIQLVIQGNPSAQNKTYTFGNIQ